MRYDSESVSVYDFASLKDLEAAVARALQDTYGIFEVKLNVDEADNDVDPFEDHEAELAVTYFKVPKIPKTAKKTNPSSSNRPIRQASIWDRLRGEGPTVRVGIEVDDHDEVDEHEYAYTFRNVNVNSLKNGALLAIQLRDNDGTLVMRNIALKRALEQNPARREPSVQSSSK